MATGSSDDRRELVREGETSGEVPLDVITDLRITRNSLHNAARDNRTATVDAHINFFVGKREFDKLNKWDSNGYAPIHYAAKFNRYDIMKKLVGAGEDVVDADDEYNSRSVASIKTRDEQWTPLHFAARYRPRYKDEAEENETEENVTYLSSSKQAVQYLINKCRVDVNAKAKDGTTPLHLACQRGNEPAVELLLASADVDESISDENGDTPLHEACLSGETKIVEKILEKIKSGRTINLLLPNDKQLTPLHIACREGYVNIVKLLLKYAFHQRDKLVTAMDNEKSTPLHLACENGVAGNDVIVQSLLLNNADIFAQMENGLTPMHIAAHYGHVKVMDMLNSSGENIFEVADEDDQTPLHHAAEHNQADMINYLLDKGADIRAADNNSYTPLLTAAASGQVNAFKILREKGARLDVLDRDGKTVVFVAAEADHVPILKVIVADNIGAKLCATPDSYYNTPLHIAAKMGHLDSVRLLIDQTLGQVKLDAKNDLGRTAMHLAAEYGHVRIVKELLNKDVDTVIDVDEDGNTPLHLACTAGSLKVAKVLIENKTADVEARNASLWTPMDCAASKGHDKIIHLLIAAKADINPVDRLKITPLHLAAREGHLDAVKVLLDSKADAGAITGGTEYGDNPLDLAIENGHEDVALAILNSDQWEKALRNTTYNPSGRQTTPLRKLIRRMPDVAEHVFNRCSKNNATKDGKVTPESKEFRVIFNYEFLEDYRDVPTRSILNCWSGGQKEPEEVDVKVNKHGYQTLDRHARKGGFTTDWGPKGFIKSNHPLSIMVESERTDLLTHPLVTSLLNQKWKSYGQIVFYSNLALYLLFLIFLTVLALVLPNPQAAICQSNFNNINNADVTIMVNNVDSLSSLQDFLNASNVTVMNNTVSVSGELVCRDSSARDELAKTMPSFSGPGEDDNGILTDGSVQCGECGISNSNTSIIFISAVIVLVIAVIRLGMELFQFLRLINALEYLKDIVNWIEVILFVCSILFAFVFFNNCLCPQTWQWEVGVVAVFLAWIDLIIFLRKIPLTGIYVLMFFDIFYTFWKMIILTSLLVVAFGLSFYMVFNQPSVLFSRSPFSHPARSILKTMTMTTGEFEFDNIFQQTPGGVMSVDEIPSQLPFPEVSYILWIIFLILMPILLTNLLVGLAVDDIKGILEAAALKRLALQVELALSVEALMPKKIRRRLIRQQNKVYPNRKLSPWEYLRYEVLKINRYDAPDKIANALNPIQTPIEQVQLQTRLLVRQIARMQETLNTLNERLEGFDHGDGGLRHRNSHHDKKDEEKEQREGESGDKAAATGKSPSISPAPHSSPSQAPPKSPPTSPSSESRKSYL